MVLIIQLIDNTNYEYDFYRNIPNNLYPLIKGLKCNNSSLDDIDFISLFPNLKKINASNNKIKIIPIVSNIEELEIYDNELIELPPLPNLKKLYAFNNKLKSLSFYPKLEIVDISHNNISNVLFGENINKVDISYNKLVNIEFHNSNNIIELDCSNNLLKDINFMHGLYKLNNIYFENNPIEVLPVHIIRDLWYPSNNITFHSLDKITTKKILKVINRFNNININGYNIIKNELYKKKLLSPNAIIILQKYIDNKIMEPTIKLTYLELFICYMNIILLNNNIEIYKKLNNILLIDKCDCISCLFKNLSMIL